MCWRRAVPTPLPPSAATDGVRTTNTSEVGARISESDCCCCGG